MSSESMPGDLASEFAALNLFLRVEADPDSALQRVVNMAVHFPPACDWAAITEWPTGRPPRCFASSDDITRTIDKVQFELGEGPSIGSKEDTGVVNIPDLRAADQWPKLTKALLAQVPARALLSFKIGNQPHPVALNFYAGVPSAFDDAAFGAAALFAAHVQVLLLHIASANQAATLGQALTTSRQIGEAIGILMNAHRITADQAFDLLRTSSSHLNRKLRDIALDVTESGELPVRT